jgi:uncharacterized protein
MGTRGRCQRNAPLGECYHNDMLHILHEEVARVMEGAAAELPAAEAHGFLSGALCAKPEFTLAEWWQNAAPDGSDDVLRAPDSVLKLLFEGTALSLRGDSMEFTPLLPDDETPLGLRTESLAQWTQGFLYGLATGEIGRRPDLPDVVAELLKDFSEISRAGLTADDAGGVTDPAALDADEEAYAELFEFVRVGVQLIYDELMPLRQS